MDIVLAAILVRGMVYFLILILALWRRRYWTATLLVILVISVVLQSQHWTLAVQVWTNCVFFPVAIVYFIKRIEA